MLITKHDGRQEAFDESKLRRSLKRAGCSEGVCNEVIDEVTTELREGDSTSKIYRRAFELLREKEKPLAARYSLKRAVLDLGPSGFPFEAFIAEIFRLRGYTTTTNKEMSGVCTVHEVDVCACKQEHCLGIEAKFHNRLGFKTDVKVVLYVHARFEDIKKAYPKGGCMGGVDEGWLITNTEFTSRAIEYGKCARITLIGWDYPERGNLQDLIEEAGVQPITALTTLSEHDKRLLIGQRLVLCRSLREHPEILESLGISESKRDTVLSESNALCGA
jgi:hypothetical protein